MPNQGKLHIHALADVVLIFDFGLRQRRAAGDTPIHRLLAAINKPLLDDVRKQPQLIRLVLLGQSQIRIIPVPEHAQAFELRPLDIDVFARIRVARRADGGGIGGRIARLPHLLSDLEFDRQPMAVPPRHVGRPEAAQRLVLDDDVLENLVQGIADVHIAIGEGRSVVQNILLRAGALGLNGSVKPGGLPLFQPGRFPRDEVRLHREIGLRQVQCVLVVHAAS